MSSNYRLNLSADNIQQEEVEAARASFMRTKKVSLTAGQPALRDSSNKLTVGRLAEALHGMPERHLDDHSDGLPRPGEKEGSTSGVSRKDLKQGLQLDIKQDLKQDLKQASTEVQGETENDGIRLIKHFESDKADDELIVVQDSKGLELVKAADIEVHKSNAVETVEDSKRLEHANKKDVEQVELQGSTPASTDQSNSSVGSSTPEEKRIKYPNMEIKPCVHLLSTFYPPSPAEEKCIKYPNMEIKPCVHLLSTFCPPSVHLLSTFCPPSIHPLSTFCPPSFHLRPTFCPPSPAEEKCFTYPNLEISGDPLIDGAKNKVATAGECCDQCLATARCNVWVWCGVEALCPEDYFQECWLKLVLQPQDVEPTAAGPHVGWITGTNSALDLRKSIKDTLTRDLGDLFVKARRYALASLHKKNAEARPYHTVTSMQGSGTAWSMRTHYYHFRKMRALCQKHVGRACEMGGFTRLLHGGEADNQPTYRPLSTRPLSSPPRALSSVQGLACEMGGFTRLLHGGEADNLMDEIPTVIVQPLPESVIPHLDYVVLNRPYAFLQWTKMFSVPEQYIFMSEPDHVMLHPIPNLMKGDIPAAYPFSYIDPSDPKSIPLVKKYTGITNDVDVGQVAQIGSSPVFMTVGQMKRVMAEWTNMSIRVFQDKAAQKEWGWVEEMYAFTISCSTSCSHTIDLGPNLML
eukprot:gene11655-34364_t